MCTHNNPYSDELARSVQILDFHIWELSFQYTATLCRRGRAPGGGGGAHFLKSTIEERDILELIHFTYHSYENICIEMLNVCNTIAQPFLTNYISAFASCR